MASWGGDHGHAARPKGQLAYTCESLSTIGITAEGECAALPLYCRKWSCQTCGQFQRKRLRKRLLAGSPTTFMTLTVNPKVHPDPVEAFKTASLYINQLFKVLRRHWPGFRIEYALVWETTKKGYPHAHILLRAPFIPQTFLSRAWKRLSGAYIVDIKRIRTQNQAANYVTKYLTKDPSVPPGYRRYRTSRGYSAPPPRGELARQLGIILWLRSAAPLPHVLIDLGERGYRLHEHMPSLYCSWPKSQLPRPP